MWQLFKAIFLLAALASMGLVAYAYLGPIFFPTDFVPPLSEVSEPVILDGQ